jgi:glycosyltransferase involved in cell wall biosynthesis
VARGVSVILPVYKNAATLPEVERRIRAALPGRDVQVVMVDDASPDDSLAVIRSLPVECVALPVNGGQNQAIWAGLRHARAPLTCVMDADLEDPPEVLPRLLERLELGDVQVVFSSRETTPRASSRAFRWLLRRLFPTLPATAGLFFALDQRAREGLLALETERAYVVAAIGALGVPTTGVAASRAPRPHGSSAYATFGRIRYAARALGSAARLRMRRRGALQRGSGQC